MQQSSLGAAYPLPLTAYPFTKEKHVLHALFFFHSVYFFSRFVDDILNQCRVFMRALFIMLSPWGFAYDRVSISAADAWFYMCGWDSLQTLGPEAWSFHQSG